MTALGVMDFRLLGGAGRYSDSGMMGLPDNDDPGCFWQADVDRAAGLLAEVILEVRPQVLVTYDDDGGYGHPDHIQAHRVAMRAVELAAEGGWAVPKVYWNRVPRSVRRGGVRPAGAGPARPALRQVRRGARTFPAWSTTSGSPPPATAPRTPRAKAAAMRAHATQITVADQPYFVLSNELAQPLLTTEYYELVRGARAAAPSARATCSPASPRPRAPGRRRERPR
ncbi:1D-myo-inositol 2-acetamido-2-deoxy-alpha-D-glucopyranoside deacetylase OS=Streptomyces tendae OX=1932 GN=mshB PE=3 SV=1 [Streptomyces tendae]